MPDIPGATVNQTGARVDATAADAQVRHQPVGNTGPTSGRVTFTDGTDRWFSANTAKGRWVARAGSTEAGNTLYYTRTGVWVLWTPPATPTVLTAPGSVGSGTVTTQTASQAASFLLRHGHDVPAALTGTTSANEV